MFKNMDYKNTYTTPEFGNVRYPSSAHESVNGWVYVFSKDEDYVYDLSIYYSVEVRDGNHWVSYSGVLPETEEPTDAEPPLYMGEDDSDPNY